MKIKHSYRIVFDIHFRVLLSAILFIVSSNVVYCREYNRNMAFVNAILLSTYNVHKLAYCRSIRINKGSTLKTKMDVDTIRKSLVNIAKQLEEIYDNDQKYRYKLDSVDNQKPSSQTEKDSIWKIINRQDSINLSKVEIIIERFGWLGPEEVGEKGSLALFFVLQHAELKIQQKYLEIVKKAATQGKIASSNYAYFIDRIEMRTGCPQTYGTQTTVLDDKCFIFPVRDAANIESRRKEAGLSPLATSFKGRTVNYDLPILTRGEEVKRDSLLHFLNELSVENKVNIDKYVEVLKKYGKASPEETNQKILKQKALSQILVRLEKMLDENGWPGYSLIGMPGSSCIFSILSQADFKTVEKYLPFLRSTVEAKQGSLGYLAFLEDKVEVGYGRPQSYGTQINSNKLPFPIKDENNVDNRRKQLGLTPLSDYLKRTYGINYTPHSPIN